MYLPVRVGQFEITDQLMASLTRLWPTKDLSTELAKMHLWLERNPKARPAHPYRFIDNWLKKADDMIAPQPKVAAWWATEQRTLNQGAALGLTARPGEGIAEYRERINERLRK